MRTGWIAAIVLALALGCSQTGDVREDSAEGPQPARKYQRGPLVPKAMQPVPSSY